MSNAKKVQDLLDRNAKYAITYKQPPLLNAMRQKVKANNGRSVIILSCSDPRIVPADFLGVHTGEFGIVRNAGGRAFDAVRSLAILDAIIPIGTVMVIHHTDCGQTLVHDEEVRESILARRPELAVEVGGMQFGEIIDVEGSVVEDLKLLKASPLLPGDMEVLGYVLDIETGLLREVKP